jgi:leucyl aminopeptidase
MTEASGPVECLAVTVPAAEVVADLLCVPVFQDEDRLDDLPGLDDAVQGEIARARARDEFRGRPFELFLTPVVGSRWKAARIALVGAGRRAEADAERLRRVAAACAYTAQLRGVSSVALVVRKGLDVAVAAAAAADGLSVAEFEPGSYKLARDRGHKAARRLVIVAPGADATVVSAAVRRGRIIGEAANFARELANEPGNALTPRAFADRVAADASAVGLTVDVLDEARIRELKMGLLLAVAQGSVEPPRVVVLRHEPKGAPASPVLGLVGKGITFDTGGISIKPALDMERMKDDMTGGASVAAAMRAIAQLGGRHRVIAVIPMSENMPGGKAVKPGDVITGASGKTVEIINTDAEGRLILGDALWYAQQLGATHLIDVATLTGAITIALGKAVSGLFGAPASWTQTVEQAAARGGDRVWTLPIEGEFREQLRSDIADMINSPGRAAGAITAACFLREFVDERPWAHLDIAGTAWQDDRKAYQGKGPTGTSVRTLIELGLSDLASGG